MRRKAGARTGNDAFGAMRVAAALAAWLLLSTCAGFASRKADLAFGAAGDGAAGDGAVGDGAAGDGVEIVQVSDLHYVPGKAVYERLLAELNALDPDLLVFTGDFLTELRHYDSLIAWLERVTLRCPKYAIYGNWEYARGFDRARLRADLERLGVRVLVNEGVDLEVGSTKARIYGVDDYLRGHPDFSGFAPLDGGLNLVLGHCPILFDELCARWPDAPSGILMLSGHTHGGQITFFGLPVVLPEGSGRYVAGAYRAGRNVLYVSAGVGTSRLPLRLFAAPGLERVTAR